MWQLITLKEIPFRDIVILILVWIWNARTFTYSLVTNYAQRNSLSEYGQSDFGKDLERKNFYLKSGS